MEQQHCVFDSNFVQHVQLKYLLYLPAGYADDPAQRWPLILFLHGAGERGDDLNLVRVHGIPKVAETRADFPFIVVSPQCPVDSWWADYRMVLTALLDQVAGLYRVDLDRVYLTGLSMGGFGTWVLAASEPQRFAAIAPICGGGFWMYGFPDRARVIKHIPTWVFHGAKDPVVPLRESEVMVEALKAHGGDVRLTIYPEAGHDSWTETYNNPEFYTWLLQHRRQAQT
jgi:predicted peptidase